MKITVTNLTNEFPNISDRLTSELMEAFPTIEKNLKFYEKSDTIKKVTDCFINEINNCLKVEKPTKDSPKPGKTTREKKTPEGKKQKGEPAVKKESTAPKVEPKQHNPDCIDKFLFIVMGKEKGGKFMPLNAKDGSQVVSMEKATRLPAIKLDDAINYYGEQTKIRLGWQFKIIKVGTNEILWQSSGKDTITKDSQPTPEPEKPAGKKSSTRKDKTKPEPKAKPAKKPKEPKEEPTPVIEITLEQAFIKTFCNFQGKEKSKTQLYRYIQQLQKAIAERKIRAKTIYSKYITYIQSLAIHTYNNMKGESKTIVIKEEWYKELKKISNVTWTEHVIIIKKFITILNATKAGLKEKARNLLDIIEASEFSEIAKDAIDKIRTSLKDYLSGKTAQPKMNEIALEGLRGLAGLNGLNGLTDTVTTAVPDNKIISSLELRDMKFELQGYTGKWLNLIGNPEKPFSAMFWGKGGSGKSTLAVEFAGYLANQLNKKILFVAREEGASSKLQERFERMKAYHRNINIVKEFPDSLAGYDYVFLDSVNTLRISCQAFENLVKQYPQICWILLFQVIKDGNFRGEQDWQHNTDVEIYCENGTATTLKSRFGAHGTVKIF